jgi:putative endonuclease
MNPGHVYILGSTTGTLYIGVTSELYLRVAQHRAGTLSGFAHEHRCTRLLYAEPFETITQAIAREKQLKGWTRAKKIALIAR